MAACSVIMVSYHTGPVLPHALRTALAQEGLAELILVDNGNPPEMVEYLAALARAEPRLKILSGQGNIGFARGCNLGARHATGEYLLLLNPDCLLPEQALSHTMQALNAHPGAMIASCHLLNPDDSEQRGGRRALLTPETLLAEYLRRKRKLNLCDTPMPATTHEVPAVSGAFMCMKRADYERLGGMDERYFLHVEDLDFCMRAHKANGKVICVPHVKVVHLLSTSEAASWFVERHKARGLALYFSTHFPYLPKLYQHALQAAFYARAVAKTCVSAVHSPKGSAAAQAGLRLLQYVQARALPPLADVSGKRVIVTGGFSHITPFLLGRLAACGADVTVTSRGSIPAMPGVRHITTTLDGSTPFPTAEALIHCAPLWTLPPALEAAKNAGVTRIVAFGSTSQFSKAESQNPQEQAVARNLREAEAAMAERCAALGINWTILRPTLIYGSGTDRNISSIARIIRRFRCFPVYPPASGLRAPVHADDLAMAAIQAAQSSAAVNKAYNLGGGEALDFRAMVVRLFALMERRVCIIPVKALPALLDAIGRILHNSHVNGAIAYRMNEDLVFPHDEAARDFGYAPRAFLAGGKRDIEGLL